MHRMPPNCPSCGKPIRRPMLFTNNAVEVGETYWPGASSPLAVGLRCENLECGVLLPLSIYVPDAHRR